MTKRDKQIAEPPEGRSLVIVERKERSAIRGSGLKVANPTRGIHTRVVAVTQPGSCRLCLVSGVSHSIVFQG
jgi:hypothetical protein